jgi:outer membrane receptor protein involved in Fe transport
VLNSKKDVGVPIESNEHQHRAGTGTSLLPYTTVLFAMALLQFATSGAVAQNARRDTLATDTVFLGEALIVTATRTPRPVFSVPAPVAVVNETTLARIQANTVTDAFRSLPGVDVTGVGAQQARPIIRGQRGQRILLLQDGIRLNNSRRQQDFGEVPALVDVASIDRVEIVRGPSSVLYGTDAIGGVINIITRRADRDGVHGTVAYRFGEEEDQHRGSAVLFGRSGNWDFDFVGSLREVGEYRAPSGRFGDIALDDDVVVHGTGVKDMSGALRLGYALSPNHDIFVRAERYESEDAGFGYVDPEDYAPDQPSINIGYPEQRFWKTTLGWSARELATPVMDRLDVTTYLQDNERVLTFDLFQSFGPQAPPGAGVAIATHNFTDLTTLGARVEARKLVSPALLITWGADAFRDDSENTDSSVTTVIGFGPPQTEVSNTPQIPNATYNSLGAFVQGEVSLGSRATIIGGGRVQRIAADADAVQGEELSSRSETTVVGALNVLYALTGNLRLIGSVGRAFRAPNLIEWFFDGPTPEGNGYQVRSPDLEPETALNFDAGVRYRNDRIAVEAFAFRNEVTNGIRIQPLGEDINGLPAFQNVNVDELVYRGVEVAAEVELIAGLRADGSWTRIESEDALDPDNPVGDSFSSKVTGGVRYTDALDRFWLGYAVRHNGERKDVALDGNPAGDVLPAFTVHTARAGFSPFRGDRFVPSFTIAVENLTNELYAEASNVSFFRPEPRRRVTVQTSLSF